MRRLFIVLLILAFFLQGSAFASGDFSETLFDDAKQALSLISYGEYKKALKRLDFSGKTVTAEDLQTFTEDHLSSIFTVAVQTDVAVAYYTGSAWRLAIPLEEPSYDTVPVFVLRSKNGKSFDGYKAMLWYEVLDEVDQAESVTWNESYDPGDLFIVADN